MCLVLTCLVYGCVFSAPPEKETKEAVILGSKSSLSEARLSGVDQEKPEPLQVKEQVEELGGGELGLKQEPEDLQLCSADGESNRSGGTVVDWNPEESSGDSGVPVIVSVVSEANTDLCLCPGVSQSPVQKNGKCKNSKPTGHKWNDPTSDCHITGREQNNSVTDSKVRRHVEVHVGKKTTCLRNMWLRALKSSILIAAHGKSLGRKVIRLAGMQRGF